MAYLEFLTSQAKSAQEVTFTKASISSNARVSNVFPLTISLSVGSLQEQLDKYALRVLLSPEVNGYEKADTLDIIFVGVPLH